MARNTLLTDAPLSVRTFGPVTLSGGLGLKGATLSLSFAYPPTNNCTLSIAIQRRDRNTDAWVSIWDHTYVGVWPLPVNPVRGVGTATYGLTLGGEFFGNNLLGGQVQVVISQMTGGTWTCTATVDH